MQEALFDVPWWILLLGAMLGLGLAFRGNRNQQAGLRGAGLGLMFLVLVWGMVSYLVETPRERCIRQTRQLVDAVVRRDWNGASDLMEPNVAFRFVGSSWKIDGREALDAAIKADVNRIDLKSASVNDLAATEQTDTITVSTKVWSVQEITLGQPLDSEWELDWRNHTGAWRLHEIRATRVSGVTPDQVRGSLGRP